MKSSSLNATFCFTKKISFSVQDLILKEKALSANATVYLLKLKVHQGLQPRLAGQNLIWKASYPPFVLSKIVVFLQKKFIVFFLNREWDKAR